MKDKLWFFGAYNHFKINKAVSGVAAEPSRPTSGSSTTTRRRRPTSQRKRHAHRLLPVGQEAEAAARPVGVDAARLDAGADTARAGCTTASGSASGRTACSPKLNIGEFGYVFPRAAGGRLPRPIRRGTTWPPASTRGAGFDRRAARRAVHLERAKPQVYGSVTYFLPTKMGSHDLKFGVRVAQRLANFGEHRHVGSDPVPGPQRRDRRNPADRPRRSAKLGSDLDDSGRRQPALARCYAQDRWAANSRVTITAGVRYDHQRRTTRRRRSATRC